MGKPNEIIPYNPALKKLARELRNNSTLSEIPLWQKIKGKILGVEFHRQVPIDEFIVEFYCHELKLAIEIDGNSHDEKQETDEIRQRRLETLGITFLRFDDLDVKKRLGWVLEELSIRVRGLAGWTSSTR
jgi:very-short-patch-repair endonuclease